MIKPIFELDSGSAVAVAYERESSLWQCHNSKKATTLEPAVQPFTVGPTGPWVQIECLAAFWEMPRSLVFDFAHYYKVDIPTGVSHFELLWAFCESTLDLDEDAILSIVHRRVAAQSTEDFATMPTWRLTRQVVESMGASEVKDE